MLGLIHRYVFRELLGPSLLGLLAYTAIFLVHKFFMLAEQWVAGTLTLPDVLLLLVYYTPSTLVQTVPMSVLLGILIGFSRLSADSEITALRATGISYYRLLVPTAAVAALGWGLSAFIYIQAVPWSNTKYVDLMLRAAQRADINREIRPGSWVTLEGAALFARGVDSSNPAEPWLLDVDIVVADTAQRKREHWRAARARVTRVAGDGDRRGRLAYKLDQVRTIEWKPDDPDQKPKLSTADRLERIGPERPLPGSRAASAVRLMQKDARLKKVSELRRTVTDLDRMDQLEADSGGDKEAMAAARASMTEGWVVKARRPTMRRVSLLEIHKKVAIPVACLVFALAAMPLGIATRRGGRPASFVISIGVIIIWYVTYLGAEAWVEAGKLAPAVGAWLPNIGLGIVGSYLLVRLRRQQRVGMYRAVRDGLLLGAALLLLFAGLLALQRLTAPVVSEAPFPRWPPVAGAVLLLGYVLFVVYRDPIARSLASVTETLRRRARSAMAESGVELEAEQGPLSSAGRDDGLARRPREGRWLDRARAALVFVMLAFAVFVASQVLTNEAGFRQGLTEVRTAVGATVLVLLGSFALLQSLGARVIRTLDWWTLTSYLKHLLSVLLALVVVYAIFQYVELADFILRNDITGAVVADYFLHLAPKMVFEMLPWAAMVAALVSFGIMTKFNETTAVRCGGVSLFRLALPVVALAVGLCLGAFLLNDRVMPRSIAHADAVRDRIKGKPPVHAGRNRGFVLSQDGRTLYQFDRLAPADPRVAGSVALIQGLSVLRHDGEGDVNQLVFAPNGRFEGNSWLLHAGWIARIGDDGDAEIGKFDRLPVPEMEPPSYFASERVAPDRMTIGDYRRYVQDQAAAGYPTGELRVKLHNKVSGSAAPFVLVLVGLPFAFTTGRRGALYGLGIGVIVAVVYFASMAVFTALGTAGYLSPLVAAWAPNALFAVAGIFMMLHVRT